MTGETKPAVQTGKTPERREDIKLSMPISVYSNIVSSLIDLGFEHRVDNLYAYKGEQ